MHLFPTCLPSVPVLILRCFPPVALEYWASADKTLQSGIHDLSELQNPSLKGAIKASTGPAIQGRGIRRVLGRSLLHLHCPVTAGEKSCLLTVRLCRC